MSLVLSLVAVLLSLVAQSAPPPARQSTGELPETKVVLRISREFIHELTAKQFKRDVPIEMDFSGTTVMGSASARGTTEVEIQASENSCNFELVVNGQVTTELVATSRATQTHLHGFAPFKGRRRIVFDDASFLGQNVNLETSYHSSIDRICSFRSGVMGALARNLASSALRRDLSQDDLKAGDEVRARLTAEIIKESDGLLATLNKVGSMVKKGEELLRDEKLLSARSVQHYLAATKRSLYISIGPPQHQIAKLPRSRASEREPIELWVAIQKPGKVDRLSPLLANWKIVKPFILPRIAQQSPETAKILDEVQVKSVDGWHIVTFAPKLLESL